MALNRNSSVYCRQGLILGAKKNPEVLSNISLTEIFYYTGSAAYSVVCNLREPNARVEAVKRDLTSIWW
jgi:hypothetical protein